MNESEIIRLADNGINCFAQIKALAQGQTPGPIDPGPGPGPTPAPAGTMELEMDWATPRRLTTRGAGPDTIIAVGFTTGGVSSPDNNLPNFTVVDGNSAPIQPRDVVLSEKPGDFDNIIGPRSEGTIQFAVGTGSNHGYYGTLELNKRYYLNIRFRAGAAGACDVDIALIKTGGL